MACANQAAAIQGQGQTHIAINCTRSLLSYCITGTPCRYGFYYLGAGYGDSQQQGLNGFYRSTVWGRLFLFAAFSVIVIRQEVERALLLPAFVNVLGAIAMHMALSKQQQQGS